MRLRQLKASDVPKLRRHLLRKQKGVCPICGKKVKVPVLDHHHKKRIKGTGQIRGTICSSCNVFLAKIENNASRYTISKEELPEVLINTAKYLSRPQYPYIHPSEAPKKKILTKSSYNRLSKAYLQSGRSAKFPAYRYNKKKKPVQGLTKPLEKLFIEFDIEPEFYK